ncbi:MAG TPA: STAS domain-containing protein [Azoarcus taiwanensis]|nr:STAS domain-containing protein [Azoarcus taiwanensis]
MDIVSEVIDEGVALRVSGRLDGATAPRLEKPLMALFAENGEQVLLDLAGLDYVSSAGLRVFLMAAKRARQVDGKLVLCGLQPMVGEVFEMSGFGRILDIAATEADGRARLRD